MDGKLVIPFNLGNVKMKTLHETHPGQFGMKFLAQYIWSPHNNRQLFFTGIKCSECTKTGKNLKSIFANSQNSELLPLLEPYKEFNLSFAGLLDSHSGTQINLFYFALIDLMNFHQQKLLHPHGIPYSNRADHASCFTSQVFKLFFISNNIELKFCTVEDHRSNGLVEKPVLNVKSNCWK